MGLWERLWGGRGPLGFGAASTVEEVTAGVDASDLTAIVTGATNGIGRETARVLALRGAKVIIPTRTMESGMKVKESISEQIPSSSIHAMEMDLSSLDSVRSFVRSFLSSQEHLNILINNAGIMGFPFHLSEDSIELQFATNHVEHFLLTNLLLDKMKKTARETGVQGRIKSVSSMVYKRSDGSCFDPKKLNDSSRVLSVFKPFLTSMPKGAATTCYLALHPDLKNAFGKYFADCNEVTPSAYARNAELAKKLWEFSEELVNRK